MCDIERDYIAEHRAGEHRERRDFWCSECVAIICADDPFEDVPSAYDQD